MKSCFSELDADIETEGCRRQSEGTEEKKDGHVEIESDSDASKVVDDMKNEDDVKEDLPLITKQGKKGVVYIRRIPPFMNVAILRQYMTQFGQVGRIYLAPEDQIRRKNRILAGGSNRDMFIDGWVEFEKKSVAKMVGNHLNNQPVGGKKRHNLWRDDLWSLRYLPKFKWHNLIDWREEKRRSRTARKTADLLQMKRENVYYLNQVDKKRKIDHIEERKKNKRKKE